MSVFSKNNQTSLKSIHFRGEEKLSWLAARLPPINARIVATPSRLRAGRPARLSAETLAGRIAS